jgi:mannose-6-phosphate isomerase-like protein (cupin superfamily)
MRGSDRHGESGDRGYRDERDKVFSVDALPWSAFTSARGYEFKSVVADPDYTSAFSCELVKVSPTGHSEPHIEPYNHALYFLQGIGEIKIGDEAWPIQQGTLAKVRAGERHSVRNFGPGEMLMLAIYDPPRR